MTGLSEHTTWGRCQCLKVDSLSSFNPYIKKGVPHGSILESLILIISNALMLIVCHLLWDQDTSQLQQDCNYHQWTLCIIWFKKQKLMDPKINLNVNTFPVY